MKIHDLVLFTNPGDEDVIDCSNVAFYAPYVERATASGADVCSLQILEAWSDVRNETLELISNKRETMTIGEICPVACQEPCGNEITKIFRIHFYLIFKLKNRDLFIRY